MEQILQVSTFSFFLMLLKLVTVLKLLGRQCQILGPKTGLKLKISFSYRNRTTPFEQFSSGALPGLKQFLLTEYFLKIMKNLFYFTKSLFVLMVFKFLS